MKRSEEVAEVWCVRHHKDASAHCQCPCIDAFLYLSVHLCFMQYIHTFIWIKAVMHLTPDR